MATIVRCTRWTTKAPLYVNIDAVHCFERGEGSTSPTVLYFATGTKIEVKELPEEIFKHWKKLRPGYGIGAGGVEEDSL